jgi:hypothetical protein
MAEGSTLQQKNIYIENVGMVSLGMGVTTYATPTGDGTAILNTTVPASGAVLQECTFTPISLGTGAHEQEWTVSDGTNILFTQASFTNPASLTVGTAATQTLADVGNGKAIATTAGARLTLTNTARGTSTQGVNGIFRLVWAL